MKVLPVVCVLLLLLPGPVSAAEQSKGSIGIPRAFGDDIPPADYLFVFATIGDSHIEPSGPADFCYLKASHKSRALLENYIDDINKHTPGVDLTIHLGDITEFGTPIEFAIAEEVLDELDCPLYSVLGNHDNFQNDGKRAWKDFAGMESTSYSFDFMNAHFVVVDCTMDPFAAPYVRCGPAILEWVEADLGAAYPRPSFVICHYNLWERSWNAKFDTTEHYVEYEGMPELRVVLESAGNVVAVINGHVHASRAELHEGIWYIDVGATLVGSPLMRYFYVCEDRVEATYRYISDPYLRGSASRLCRGCVCCFDRESVCKFIEGTESDKVFTMPFSITPPSNIIAGAENLEMNAPQGETPVVKAPGVRSAGAGRSHMRVLPGAGGRVVVETGGPGWLTLSLYDVLGRSLDRHAVHVTGKEVSLGLADCFGSLSVIPDGVYFLHATINGQSANAKLVLPFRGSM